jgi:hypothetical protein
VAIVDLKQPPLPWWTAPEFLMLAELRRAMASGTAVPSGAARTAEEDARHAVFWAIYEIEQIVREYAKLVEAGEPVRMRAGVYKHHDRRVDFNVQIVDREDAAPTVRS